MFQELFKFKSGKLFWDILYVVTPETGHVAGIMLSNGCEALWSVPYLINVIYLFFLFLHSTCTRCILAAL